MLVHVAGILVFTDSLKYCFNSVTANLISEESYWERCCRTRWTLCDISCYNKLWKKMFFERHTEEVIEHFVPEKSDQKEVELGYCII